MSRADARIGCRRAEVLFDAYVDGELPSRRVTQLEAHVAGCFACRQELESARRLRAALRDLPERFCSDAVIESVRERVQGMPRTADARPLAGGGWERFVRQLVPLWQPAAAAVAIVVLVFGVSRVVLRPPTEQRVTAQDVARAELQVRWVMARLNDINRRTGAKVRDDVLSARVVEPTARAVENVFESGTP